MQIKISKKDFDWLSLCTQKKSDILIRPSKLAGAGRSQSRWVTLVLTLLENFAVACQGKGCRGFTQHIFNHNYYLTSKLYIKTFSLHLININIF